MRRPALLCALAVVGAVLAACQTDDDQRASIAPPPARGIEGTWSSAAGPVAYSASFQSGRFSSTETGTGAVLASGTYQSRGPNQVSILYTSLARNEQISVNCNRTAENRLDCVNSGGSRFELTRRA